MKAVILAAGKGERLKNLTKGIPKPMIQFRGKPLLLHNIELCKRYGIRDLYINTHHLPGAITSYFGDGKKFDVNIHYSLEQELLGTAGGVKNFEEFLKDEPFFVIYADNISDFDLRATYDYHQLKQGIATITLFEKKDVSMSGIAILGEDNRILRFIEKPRREEQISHLVNAGIYVLSPRVFDYIPFGFSDFGKDIFPELISSGEALYGIVMEGNVIAVDTIDLYAEAAGK